LALLLPQRETAREGGRSAKMLVRALKMLDYYGIATIGMASPRQPLISRAVKAALMTEAGRIGNAETRAERRIGPAGGRSRRRADRDDGD